MPPANSLLDFIIVSAKFIIDLGVMSKQDPFVIVQYNNNLIVETTVKKKAGLNVQWNERFRIMPLIEPDEIQFSALTKNFFGNKVIGQSETMHVCSLKLGLQEIAIWDKGIKHLGTLIINVLQIRLIDEESSSSESSSSSSDSKSQRSIMVDSQESSDSIEEQANKVLFDQSESEKSNKYFTVADMDDAQYDFKTFEDIQMANLFVKIFDLKLAKALYSNNVFSQDQQMRCEGVQDLDANLLIHPYEDLSRKDREQLMLAIFCIVGRGLSDTHLKVQIESLTLFINLIQTHYKYFKLDEQEMELSPELVKQTDIILDKVVGIVQQREKYNLSDEQIDILLNLTKNELLKTINKMQIDIDNREIILKAKRLVDLADPNYWQTDGIAQNIQSQRPVVLISKNIIVQKKAYFPQSQQIDDSQLVGDRFLTPEDKNRNKSTICVTKDQQHKQSARKSTFQAEFEKLKSTVSTPQLLNTSIIEPKQFSQINFENQKTKSRNFLINYHSQFDQNIIQNDTKSQKSIINNKFEHGNGQPMNLKITQNRRQSKFADFLDNSQKQQIISYRTPNMILGADTEFDDIMNGPNNSIR